MNFFEELKWRGMIHDVMPGTDEQLNKEMTSAYVGIDPTADSLHIGHLVSVMMLKHFQLAGHKPIALVGGATGMIGDPSGKSQERNLLDEPTLRHNQECLKNQLKRFLDFETTAPNVAELVNNYDWMKDFSFLSFIRDVGKHITVNYMMAKDSVKKRITAESGEGMSFTEFTYQLVQGYDFLHLYRSHNCRLQMGGSDQWGNITTGTELIRRIEGGDAFALTCPLIKKSDGTKFGKTEKGNVWLDPAKTSPYQFYQFWLNASDEDSEKWIKIFTLLTKDEVDELVARQKEAPHQRALQKKLAEELTCFVHGRDEYDFAVKASEILFGNAATEVLKGLTEDQLLQVMEGVPSSEYSFLTIKEGVDIVTFLAETSIFSSKGEARKMVQGSGISINKAKIESVDTKIDQTCLLNNKYILVQKGKKNYFLVHAI